MNIDIIFIMTMFRFNIITCIFIVIIQQACSVKKNDLSKNEIISKSYLTGSVTFLERWQSPIPYIGIVNIKNF